MVITRSNARLIRFVVFALVLIGCGYLLTKGSSYEPPQVQQLKQQGVDASQLQQKQPQPAAAAAPMLQQQQQQLQKPAAQQPPVQQPPAQADTAGAAKAGTQTSGQTPNLPYTPKNMGPLAKAFLGEDKKTPQYIPQKTLIHLLILPRIKSRLHLLV